MWKFFVSNHIYSLFQITFTLCLKQLLMMVLSLLPGVLSCFAPQNHWHIDRIVPKELVQFPQMQMSAKITGTAFQMWFLWSSKQKHVLSICRGIPGPQVETLSQIITRTRHWHHAQAWFKTEQFQNFWFRSKKCKYFFI